MTQEQQTKMEQEVRAYTIPYIRNHGHRMGDIVKQDFTSIYQNILDNPSEWGLVYLKDLDRTLPRIAELNLEMYKEIEDMKSQLAKYREALENIITEVHTTRHEWGDNMDNIDTIAKEALKQQ